MSASGTASGLAIALEDKDQPRQGQGSTSTVDFSSASSSPSASPPSSPSADSEDSSPPAASEAASLAALAAFTSPSEPCVPASSSCANERSHASAATLKKNYRVTPENSTHSLRSSLPHRHSQYRYVLFTKELGGHVWKLWRFASEVPSGTWLITIRF